MAGLCLLPFHLLLGLTGTQYEPVWASCPRYGPACLSCRFRLAATSLSPSWISLQALTRPHWALSALAPGLNPPWVFGTSSKCTGRWPTHGPPTSLGESLWGIPPHHM